MLEFTETPGKNGWQVDIDCLLRLILEQSRTLAPGQKLPEKIKVKVTYDGATFNTRPAVMAYLVPLNVPGFPPQSPKSCFPLAILGCPD